MRLGPQEPPWLARLLSKNAASVCRRTDDRLGCQPRTAAIVDARGIAKRVAKVRAEFHDGIGVRLAEELLQQAVRRLVGKRQG